MTTGKIAIYFVGGQKYAIDIISDVPDVDLSHHDVWVALKSWYMLGEAEYHLIELSNDTELLCSRTQIVTMSMEPTITSEHHRPMYTCPPYVRDNE